MGSHIPCTYWYNQQYRHSKYIVRDQKVKKIINGFAKPQRYRAPFKYSHVNIANLAANNDYKHIYNDYHSNYYNEQLYNNNCS